jgi:excisionase family DNA binding protein
MNISMPKFSIANESAEVCGTWHASKLLGLSVGTVQALVDKGELKAWKTKGGHRRVFVQSLKDFQKENGLQVSSDAKVPSFRMLVVDDDPVFLTLVEQACCAWDLDVQCIRMNSAIEALMNIRTLQPRLLLTDLHLPKIDGFEFIRQLRCDKQFAKIHIVAVTAMKTARLAQAGALPPGVLLMEKPLDMQWLRGYVAALTGTATLV